MVKLTIVDTIDEAIITPKEKHILKFLSFK